MAEDPQPLTLQQRIAALNAAHIGRVPGESALPRPKPQIPSKRPTVIRQKTVNNPPKPPHGSATEHAVGNLPIGPGQNRTIQPHSLGNVDISQRKSTPPPLPARHPSTLPPLPARRPSEQSTRRDSADSQSSGVSKESVYSNGSGLVTVARTKSNDALSSRIRAPAWGECELPALPARGSVSTERKYSSERSKYELRAPSSSGKPSQPQNAGQAQSSGPKPSLPPRLPPRKSLTESNEQTMSSQNSVHRMPPIPTPAALERVRQSTLSYTLNKDEVRPAPNATEQSDPSTQRSAPPPIPLASRPDLSAIQATKPHPNPATVTYSSSSPATTCMICRDFSAPDHHASLFPRTQVVSTQQLALQLTSPFPSLTDKARAIFTWLHHNIRYDVDSFFSHNIRPSTPQSTLQTGLAVCEGYAGLFTSLATHAGLESVVISGHGKGYGYSPLAHGAPIPPYTAGHAWNAVRIDEGEWKLIDACWGAGHVQGAGKPYVQEFNPSYFTMSNEEFGVKHFPESKEMFFLPGGRQMSWEAYIQINPDSWPLSVEPPTVFTSAEDYGIGKRTVMPRERKISPRNGGAVRFQFSLLCPHWTTEHTKKGPPPVFIMATHGVDGRKEDFVPLEHVRGQNAGGGGDWWYCDIEARELGAPGQTLTLFGVTTFGERQNARGLTVREFREGKGRVAMGFQGVAAWDLV